MKLHIPHKLRAALIVAILSLSNYTLPIAYAKSVAENEIDLTLTLGTDSAYELTKTSTAGDFSITKYTWDAVSYTLTPLVYDVDIKSLGSTESFEWINNPHSNYPHLHKAPSYSPSSDITASASSITRLTSVISNIDRDFVGIIWEIRVEAEEAFGGAFSHQTALIDFDISGHFIGNTVLKIATGSNHAYGGGIYSTEAIANVRGDFIRNSTLVHTTSGGGRSYGGAIYTKSSITSITGDFIGNYAYNHCVDNAYVGGGAIYSEKNISSISGDFIGNFAYGATTGLDDTRALVYGGALFTEDTLGTITADFVGNYAELAAGTFSYGSGGAIYNGASLTRIKGTFVGNHVKTSTTPSGILTQSSYLRGGAFYNLGETGSIEANFLGNYIYSYSRFHSEGEGAAIYNVSSIDTISGIFSANYIDSFSENTVTVNTRAYARGGAIFNYREKSIEHISADFIGNFAKSHSISPSPNNAGASSEGGAIYNGVDAVIANISANFVGNYVEVKTENARQGYAYGGAIYNFAADIGFLALDRSMEFTGNYKKDNDVISSDAIFNHSGNLHFNAYGSHSITVNDAIYGDGNNRSSQIIDINNDLDGNSNPIDNGTEPFSTVAFNNRVTYHTINVHAGTLSLGQFAGTTLASGQKVDSSTALLYSSALNVLKDGHVITQAAHLGIYDNRITNDGHMSIGSGKISSKISGTGRITFTGDVALDAALSLSYASSNTEAALSFTTGASLTIDTKGSLSIDFTGGGTQWENFITWADTNDRLTTAELNNMLTVTFDGRASSTNGYQLTETAQGFSLTEIWNAQYELVAVAAGNTPSVFAVTNFDSNVYDVVINDPLGEPSATEAIKYYKWEANTTTGSITLVDETDTSLADISANSSNNTTINTSLSSWVKVPTIDYSFIGHVTGAALRHYDTTHTLSIDSDFVANVNTESTIFSNLDVFQFISDKLGAGLNNRSQIELMKGDFVGNGISTSITFKNNTGDSITGIFTSRGSAIYNEGKINAIEGDFLGNYIHATYLVENTHTAEPGGTVSAETTGFAQGGAVYNSDKIGSISGDFIGNYVYANISAHALTASSKEYVQGGAIHNEGIIARIESNFIGNYVASEASNTYDPQGGAISNIGGSIGILAMNRSIHFTGNYVSEYEIIEHPTLTYSEIRSSNAIHNETDGDAATIRLNAYGAHTLTINDAITGKAGAKISQHLDINSGRDGDSAEIDAKGADFSTVYFNDSVSDQYIRVYAGELIFGSYNGAATRLAKSTLEVWTTAQVTAVADYLGSSNDIINDNNITLTGGTLRNLISGDGTIFITGDVGSNADYLGNKVVIAPNTTLTLTDGLVFKDLTGDTSSRIEIAGNVRAAANHLQVQTQVNQYSSLTLTEGILGSKIESAAATAQVIIDGNVSADADDLKIRVYVNEDNTLTLTEGRVTETISGIGSLQISGLVESSADYIKLNTSIDENMQLNFTGGELTADVSGKGRIRILADMVADADNIKVSSKIDSLCTLSLKEGTIENTIQGPGILKIIENVTANADNLLADIRVEGSAELTLTEGEITRNISGDGRLNIDGHVSTEEGDDLQVETRIIGADDSLTIKGGTISNIISGEGSVIIAGDTTSNADFLAARTEVRSFNALTLIGGTMKSDLYGAGDTRIEGEVTLSATLSTRNLTFSYDASTADMSSLHLTQGGSLDMSNLSFINLNLFGKANSTHIWNDFISWDTGLSTGLSLDILEDMASVYYNASRLHSDFYTISQTGDAYTLEINAHTDVKYQLVAKASPTNLETELTVTPSDSGTPVKSSVVFDGSLGDDPRATASDSQGQFITLSWQETRANLIRLGQDSSDDADIVAYSHNNVTVNTNDGSFSASEVNHSILGRIYYPSLPDTTTMLQGFAIAHTKPNTSIDILGDLIANRANLEFYGEYTSPLDVEMKGVGIFNGSGIGVLSGDVIGNIAEADIDMPAYASSVQLDISTQGAGMHNAATVDTLSSDFVGNAIAVTINNAYQESSQVLITGQGAGLYNEGTLSNVTSDFVRNTIYISSYSNASETIIAQGAGLYNTSENVSLESDFIGNTIAVHMNQIPTANGTASGAAIYNAGGSIELKAKNRSIQMTDNSTYFTGNTSSSGIFNAGAAGDVASISLNAFGKETITINDSISGNESEVANQKLHINNGSDGTVYITNLVENQSITLHAGKLVLGAYNKANALLSATVLDVEKDAVLTTYADYLGKANDINNDGTINIAGGTLTNAIGGQGFTKITENTQSDASLLGNNVSIADDKGLSLTGGVLDVEVSGGVDSLIGILGSVSTKAGNLMVESYVAEDQTLTLTGGALGVKVGGHLASKLLIADDVSSDMGLLAINTHIAADKTLSLTGTELKTTITGDTGSRLSLLDSVTTYADFIGVSTEIAAGKTLTIVDGVLGGAVTGGLDSRILITENVSSNADYIGLSTEVSDDAALILTTGELKSSVEGPGIIYINGEVTTHADNLGASTQILTDKTLILTGGDIDTSISGAGMARITTDMRIVGSDKLASRISIDTDKTLTLENSVVRQDISGAGRVDIVGNVDYYSSHTNTGGTHLADGGNQLRIVGNHNHTLSDNALTMHGSDGSLTKLHVTTGSALSVASAASLISLYATDNDPFADGFNWTVITWENGAHMLSQSQLLAHIELNDNANLEEEGFYLTLGDDKLSYILTDVRPAPDSYQLMAWSYSGKAGAKLLDDTVTSGMKAGADLQDVLNSMDEIYKESDGATIESDHLAAALAGASVTSLGSSMMSNIRGQLQKVRNRAGGFIPTGESDFWISAENSRYKLDGEGTAAGHSISNWGGSLGAQRSLSEQTSIGFAVTALYGELDAYSVDRAEGDMDTIFVSLMAQHQSGNWTHHFVGSYGHADASLNRSVSHRNGSYETEGETKGYSLGFMYEAGYEMQLGNSTVLTPVLNASIAHSYVDGYTETGSDAALDVGEQENTYATVGAGARIAHTFDMGLQLGARALVKFDVGGSEQETSVSLAEVPDSYGHLRGTEAGVMGFEFGMGASLPVGADGALFMDATVELRDNQENYNASVGYKLSF